MFADFLGLSTWYVVMLTANIITEKDTEQRTKPGRLQRPCCSEVTQDTEFPLPDDIMGISLQAPCPGFPFCARHIGFLYYFALNSRLSEGKQVFSTHTLLRQFGPKSIADVWGLTCSLDLSSQVPLTLIPRARLPGSLLAMLGLCT